MQSMRLGFGVLVAGVLLLGTAGAVIECEPAVARVAVSEKLAIAEADHIPFAGHLYLITTYSDETTALYQAGPSGPYGTGHLVVQNYVENPDPPSNDYVVPPGNPPRLDAAFKLFDYSYGLWPVAELPYYDAFTRNSNSWAFGLLEVSGFQSGQVGQLVSTLAHSSGLDPIAGTAHDAAPVVPFFYGLLSSSLLPVSSRRQDAVAASQTRAAANVAVLNARLRHFQRTSRQLPPLPDAHATAVTGNIAYVAIADWSSSPSPENHETPLEQDYRYGQVWQAYYSRLTGTPSPHVVIVYTVVTGRHLRAFRQECCERF